LQTGGAQAGINLNDCRNIPLPLIPLDEQKRIANFLDEKCAEIDKLSEDIQKQIEILEDYKKSVITRAVTKGLNPNAEMKDSNNQWIGKIPTHWKKLSLKYAATYNDEALTEGENPDFEFDYIDIGSVEYGKGITQLQRMKYKDAPSRARRIVRSNDIILSTVRTYLKAIAIIPVSETPIIVSTGFLVARAKNKVVTPQFLAYAMQSNTFVSAVESESYGVSYPAITAQKAVQCEIMMPPKDEQAAIAAFLDEKCAFINSSIAIKMKQLSSLEQYKKSLIYEYVTGKKRVKGAL
jgi:type I restriction enzyme S subunit